jgi:hypothetical protein
MYPANAPIVTPYHGNVTDMNIKYSNLLQNSCSVQSFNDSGIDNQIITVPSTGGETVWAPKPSNENLFTVPISQMATVATQPFNETFFTAPTSSMVAVATHNHSSTTTTTTKVCTTPTPQVQSVSNNQAVVNLSNLQLTPSMRSILTKGLQFCPTPGEPDTFDLQKDLTKFHLSLRRKQFFSDPVGKTLCSLSTNSQIQPTLHTQEDEVFDHSTFRNPSKWNPPAPPYLEAMITKNELDLNEHTPRAPNKHNLTTEENLALKELMNLKDYIIKPADKGSAVVIQNRHDYVKEGLRQLNDQKFYMEVHTDLTELHNQESFELIKDLVENEEISEKCADYLYIAQPRTPQLYLLPKIHKNKTPVPGRPIVSANNSPTERISQLADHFLKPLVQNTKSYVKDTTDFINKIEMLPNFNDDTILCTVDVTSLYTNIPNMEGIRACQKQLDQHRQNTECLTNNNILRLLDFVLSKNNFDFDDKHYLQIGGTAMGTRVAPSFANLFMADFEDKHVYTYPLQPSIWMRYIDDIFLIWPHGEQELNNFLHHLNQCHTTIKFTSDQSTTHINFLDTTVHMGNDGKLYTDLYCKPTDSHNYLLYDSAHPQHCKDSLPYSQLLRVRRICSHITDFDKNATMMCRHFLRRNYPINIIEEALIKVRRLDRQELLKQKTAPTKEANRNLFLITTFTPQDNKLSHIVKKNWSILGRTSTTQDLYNYNVIFGNRRNKNLRDLLVHAKLPNMSSHPPPIPYSVPTPLHHCKTKNCRYCKVLDRSGRITSTTTKRSYHSMINVSCKSNNLIYCITCNTCKAQYVGQTSNRLMDRFQGHFHSVTSKSNKNVIGRHYNSHDHNGQPDFTIHIVNFVCAPSKSIPGKTLRDNLERKWIFRLNCIAPQGLNIV